MSWNLYLAFVPLALSVILFRSRQPTSWLWWLMLLIIFVFLPNAPYLLKEIIHGIDLSRMSQSIWRTFAFSRPLKRCRRKSNISQTLSHLILLFTL